MLIQHGLINRLKDNDNTIAFCVNKRCAFRGLTLNLTSTTTPRHEAADPPVTFVRDHRQQRQAYTFSSRRLSSQQRLARGSTFSSKKFLRSRLARSLRGSLRSSTGALAEPPLGSNAHPLPDKPRVLSFESEVLSTVPEEDPGAVDDWLDDFQPVFREEFLGEVDDRHLGSAGGVTDQTGISLLEHPAQNSTIDKTPPGVPPEPLSVNPTSQLSDPFATPTDYRSPIDSLHPVSLISRSSSYRTNYDKAPAVSVRHRTSSRASRQSRRSSRHISGLHDIRLILDFPLPPSNLPTPISSKLADPTQDSAPSPPIADNSSVFFDQDPFRAESPPQKDSVDNQSSQAKSLSGSATASFHTALSRAPTPATSAPSSVTTKASSTLRRFGSLTKDTLRASFRTPISQISASSRRRSKRSAVHVPAENSPERSEKPKVIFQPLPEFVPEALDIDFSSYNTAATLRRNLVSHLYSERSFSAYYRSLEDLLSRPIPREEPATPRTRFTSAPSLLPDSSLVGHTRSQSEPANLVTPAAASSTPASRPPRPTRPLPLPPPQSQGAIVHELVNPLELTASPTYSLNELRYSTASSFAPSSPSWLSRNVQELENWLATHTAPSPQSVYSDVTEVDPDPLRETDNNSLLSSPSPLPIPPSLPLPYPAGEVLHIRGRIAIHDANSSEVTLNTIETSNDFLSDSTLTVPSQRGSRHTSASSASPSLRPNNSPSKPPLSPSKARSRTSSVTRATITHYRRSIVEGRRKSRACAVPSNELINHKEQLYSKRSAPQLFSKPEHAFTTSTRTVTLLPPLDIISVVSPVLDSTPTPVLPIRPRPYPPTPRTRYRNQRGLPRKQF
ncbi:hypothetical protein EW146_g2447 [Bondarzewia mesenterica]|uniref:Uncharacterized protein n=1 Tax=Bondarzewia mesenterica TaxID=1095465 RepID=A0A4S4M6U4_9AGAM|nr:hypothetical protein EW146_g2447 [Bondarzewia mesenterica]